MSGLSKQHKLEVYTNQKLPQDYKKRLEKLSIGKRGIMWYRLQDESKMHVLVVKKGKGIIAWAMLDKCITDKRRVDFHAFVDKKHRGNGIGSFLRDKMFALFGEQFSLFYYFDSKRKDFYRWPQKSEKSSYLIKLEA